MMDLIKTISDFHFIRVSLVVWRINGPSRIKNIDTDAGDKLKALSELKINDQLPIVIDFKNIVTLTDGALSDFFNNLIILKKEIHFINCLTVRQTLRNLFDEFNTKDQARLSDNGDVLILHFDQNIKLIDSNTVIIDKINSFWTMKLGK